MTNKEFIILIQDTFGSCSLDFTINTIFVKVGSMNVSFYSYEEIRENDPDAFWRVEFRLDGIDRNIDLGTSELEIKVLILKDIFNEINEINQKVKKVNQDLVKFQTNNSMLFREYRLSYFRDNQLNELEDDRV